MDFPFPFALKQYFDRRQWLRLTTFSGLGAMLSSGCKRTESISDNIGSVDTFLRFPGKIPMRAVNSRPPCLETPWRFFQEDLTPNSAFYVRWHLQGLPVSVDSSTWRLKVGGHVERPVELSMDDLRAMEASTVVAVNQCSGNSRSFFDPHMPGAQWGNGAMGNARWTGVPLQKVLRQVGLKSKAVDVCFAALDRAGMPEVPNFVKSLPLDEALRPDILLAYEMNGEPLPLLNGFPLRLIVPGWYATYWVKALVEITVLPNVFNGYWMNPSYRIPVSPNIQLGLAAGPMFARYRISTTPSANETPDHLATQTVPISRMNIRSFITSPEEGARIAVSQPCLLSGIAFDGGDGIRKVEVSVDDGRTWRDADLGSDLGRYSFRRWHLAWQPASAGTYTVQVRATSNSGQTQSEIPNWNRGGYMRNVIERMSVIVV